MVFHHHQSIIIILFSWHTQILSWVPTITHRQPWRIQQNYDHIPALLQKQIRQFMNEWSNSEWLYSPTNETEISYGFLWAVQILIHCPSRMNLKELKGASMSMNKDDHAGNRHLKLFSKTRQYLGGCVGDLIHAWTVPTMLNYVLDCSVDMR